MRRLNRVPIARAAGALALALTLLPAQAAIVSFPFVAPVTAGPFAGEVGSGVIRFDDTFSGTLSPAVGAVEVDFSWLGQSFDETNDLGFPDFPELTVLDGVPVAIDFLLVQGSAGVDFDDDRIALIALQGVLLPDGAAGSLRAPIDIEIGDPGVVPEPATFGLASLALLGLGWRRRPAPR